MSKHVAPFSVVALDDKDTIVATVRTCHRRAAALAFLLDRIGRPGDGRNGESPAFDIIDARGKPVPWERNELVNTGDKAKLVALARS